MSLFLIYSFLGISRVLGLKYLPPLLLISSLSIMISLAGIMNYAQDKRNGSIDLLCYFMLLISFNLPLCSLLTFSFILFNALTLISMKYFISITMIVSNLIDLFLFGLISVIIN